jgi:transketolase
MFRGWSADRLTWRLRPKRRSSEQVISKPCGKNFHFGIREHAMGAIRKNCMALSGLRALGIYVYTHDSIRLGEEEQTHLPIGHLMSNGK